MRLITMGKSSALPRTNPEILRWARETAGLSIENAATALGIAAARGLSGSERLRACEAGEAEPTRPMLVKMAKRYRRPLLVFYLSAPPRRGVRGEDFRKLPQDSESTDDALLDALLRDVAVRQRLVRAALEEEDEAVPLPFVGAMRPDEGVDASIQKLRTVLGIDLEAYRKQSSPMEAFAFVRGAAEKAGVFVVLRGNLGSHHSNLPLSVFRGFALADPMAPFVVINEQDAPAAWSFTLLHEMVHLLLGETGVSGQGTGRLTEQFANQVASEFLLPASELVRDFAGLQDNVKAIEASIGPWASARNVSASAVAYRLFQQGRVSKATWRAIDKRLRDRWLSERGKRREQSRSREGGPDYYVVRAHRVGHALLGLTERMMRTGALSTTDAGKVLGVRGTQVHSLLAAGNPSGARHSA